MVLNLHGECPSDHAKNITVLNAEVRIRGALFFQFGGLSRRDIILLSECFLLRHLLSRHISEATTLNAPS
jgi:hypothetical protein